MEAPRQAIIQVFFVSIPHSRVKILSPEEAVRERSDLQDPPLPATPMSWFKHRDQKKGCRKPLPDGLKPNKKGLSGPVFLPIDEWLKSELRRWIWKASKGRLVRMNHVDCVFSLLHDTNSNWIVGIGPFSRGSKIILSSLTSETRQPKASGPHLNEAFISSICIILSPTDKLKQCQCLKVMNY